MARYLRNKRSRMLWTYRQEQKVAICDKKAVKIRGAECCGLTDRSRRWQSVTRKQLKLKGAERCGLTDRSRRWQSVARKQLKLKGAERCGLTDRSRRWQPVTRNQLKSAYKNSVPRTDYSLYSNACCIIFGNTLDTGFNQNQRPAIQPHTGGAVS